MPAKVASTHALTLADEGVRFQRLTRALFAVVWLVPGTVAGIQVAIARDGVGQPSSLARALIWQWLAWLLWAFWAQAILWLVARVPINTRRLGNWLAVHCVAMAIVCGANTLAIAGLDSFFSGTAMPYWSVVRGVVMRILDFQIVLYWAVLGAAYMVEYVKRYRERDRAAYELEQKLAQTQLDALRMQLNPHFLFNALNSVAELMEMDVREAQRTLTRVSDLLRLSLRSAASSTIPLWQEIELVELYLQIARVRYGKGLDVDVDLDPSAVDLNVPSFLLQPLVENALKHGLAPGQFDQTIRISARREGKSLALVVIDNGSGLDGQITASGRFLAARPSVDGLGIGLTNTRSRLTMMYGDRYAFRMNNQANGGCRVEVRIPLD